MELLRRFARPLSPWFRLVPNTAGFNVAAVATRAVEIRLLQRLARGVDVGLYAPENFYTERTPQSGRFLGCGAIETLDIEPALSRMRDVLLEMSWRRLARLGDRLARTRDQEHDQGRRLGLAGVFRHHVAGLGRLVP